MMTRVFFVLGWFAGISAFSVNNFKGLPEGCDFDKECIVELPGAICADGSPSFFSLIARKDSPHLLIFLQPGGACWDRKTCRTGHVRSLSREESLSPLKKETGLLDLENPNNPLYHFNLVRIPYCTGDIFLGNREINYGSEANPKIIRHKGFQNVILTMNAIRTFFPEPEKVVLFGRSAGGLGVLGHMATLNDSFPFSQKFALADAGTPLLPPYVDQENMFKIMENWNAFETISQNHSSESIRHFGDLLSYNTNHFPHIRYGLVQSYNDAVMTFFAKSVGSEDAATAVQNSIVLASDNYLGKTHEQARVFFVRGRRHLLTKHSLANLKSNGVSLLDWLRQMFSDDSWINVRPDLVH